jgi:uncharacterized membrane protein
MKSIEQHCPTYTRWCIWLWNSPTFTTWGKFLAQSLSLFAVTPLLLTRFDESEITAWYLFASLNFFGTVLSQRLGLTFSRMFAFAMGGASNLSPITGKREQENDGKPNWTAFERAYGTIGSINLAVGWVNVLIAFGMGWYGLNNILEGYANPGMIWAAFGVTQLTSLLSFIYQRYSIALQGMNYIALSNRWQIIFTLVGILVGAVALTLGANMLILVLVMRPLTLLGLLRNRFLLGHVENGRVLEFRAYGFDREVFGWAWAPTWKGFIGQFGLNGSAQLTAVIYTAYGSKLEVASFLFAMRMLQTITQIAQAPFSSVQPLMARLMAAGDVEMLGKLIRQRMGYSLALTAAGVGFGSVAIPFLLQLIGAKIGFIPVDAWLLLGGLTLLLRFDVLCCAVSATGNQMVYYWDMAAAAVISAVALLLLGNSWSIYTPIITSTIPLVLILNFRPIRQARLILNKH